MPLCICASIVLGFTYIPQSIAQTTRWTRTSPAGDTDTSATWAANDSNDLYTAMPRLRPAGSGVPHPAVVAANSSTPLSRAAFASSVRRYS